MSFSRLIPTFVMVGLVAGCTTPQGSGRPTSGDSSVPDSAPAQSAMAVSSSSSSSVGTVSNTAVGQKARELQAETDRLEAATAEHTTAHNEVTSERAQLSQQYFTQVAQINSRLEAGTTPGNPELVAQWQGARTSLSNLDSAAAQLTDISTKFTDDTAQATYLSQSIRAAFTLRGAVDADHAALRKLAGRVASTGAALEQTLGTVLDELNRQNEMLAVEHRNLVTLARAVDVGQLLGSNLGIAAGPLPRWTTTPPPAPPKLSQPGPVGGGGSSVGAPARLHQSGVALPAPGEQPARRSRHHGKPTPDTTTAPVTSPDGTVAPADSSVSPPPTEMAPGTPAKPSRHATRIHTHLVAAASIKGRPLIVIPVASEDDSYQRQLYTAVSGALETAPASKFLVVAATPRSHNRGQAVLDAAKAQRQAEDIARSLVAFGLPMARIQTVTTTGPVDSVGEIKVFAKR